MNSRASANNSATQASGWVANERSLDAMNIGGFLKPRQKLSTCCGCNMHARIGSLWPHAGGGNLPGIEYRIGNCLPPRYCCGFPLLNRTVSAISGNRGLSPISISTNTPAAAEDRLKNVLAIPPGAARHWPCGEI